MNESAACPILPLVLCVLALDLCVAEAVEPRGPVLPCVRAARAPVVDGVLDEAAWAQLPAATGFSELGSGGTRRAFRQTTLMAAHDDTALYLGIVCVEPDPASVVAKVTRHDGPVWLEDAVELFLQPKPDTRSYYHLIINAKGVCYDAAGSNAAWNAAIRVAARQLDTHWQLEVAIPWQELGVAAPAAGAEWGFNVGREHRPPGAPEWSTWMPLAKGKQKFGLPELFGRLRFVAQAKPAAISLLDEPTGLVTNPDFTALDAKGAPTGWQLASATRCVELAPLSGQRAVANDSTYLVAGQRLDVPVKQGRFFTAIAIARATGGAQMGIAVRREETDGKQWDIYPFWKKATAGKFTVYTQAFIVPPKTKRLVAANLYRSNKRGTLWIDYVQVLPGLHGHAMISDLKRVFQADRQPIGTPAPSPHLPVARPLAGGPLRALCLATRRLREVHELAQRLEMDYDLILCPKARKGPSRSVYAYNPREILSRLNGVMGRYDVIVMAAAPTTQELLDRLSAAVAGGTGLVLVRPIKGHTPSGEPWASFEAILPKAMPVGKSPHWIASGAAGARLSKLGVGRHGKGRIVVLRLADATSGLISVQPGTGRWWEGRYGLLARAALWAARGEPQARIARATIDAAGQRLHVEVDNPKRLPLTASCVWDHEKLPERGWSPAPKPRSIGADAKLALALPLPAAARQAAGHHRATIILRDPKGGTLDWTTVERQVAPPVRLAEVKLAKDTFAPNDSAEAQVTVHADAAAKGLRLSARLVDAFGRVVDATSRAIDAPAGESRWPVAFTVRRPLAVFHELVVDLADGEGVLDRQRAEVLVPTATVGALDDFQLATGYTAIPFSPPGYLVGPAVEFLRKSGFSCIMPDKAAVRCGMLGFRSSATKAGGRYGGTDHVRPVCFSNPAHVQNVVDTTLKFIEPLRRWGFIGYTMWDEIHLSQNGKTEVCFCDACRKAFPQWLRRLYKSVDELNAAWGTQLKAFEDAQPILRADAAKRATQGPLPNLAQWVDFRRFMEHSWIGVAAHLQAAMKARWPEARLSFTNPYRFGPLSGTNQWLMTRTEDILLKYFKGANTPRYRSYTTAPMVSWFGYQSGAEACRRYLWWFALNGGVMPIWWDPLEPWEYGGKRGLVAWQCFDPLWRHTARSKAVAESAADLRRGFGKLLRTARRMQAQVAILHSQESMHLAYALDATLPEGQARFYSGWQRSDESWRRLLDQCGIAYDYIAADELRGDAPAFPWQTTIPGRPRTAPRALAGYKLLILPYTLALSPRSAEAIADFAAGGGHVAADVLPGIADEHGTPRPTENPVAALFGVRFGALPQVCPPQCVVSFTGKGFAALGGDDAPYQAQALGEAGVSHRAVVPGVGDALFARAHHQGRAVCLGFVPRRGPASTALAARLTRDAGVGVPYAVTDTEGAAVHDVETYVYQLGHARYVALVRSAAAEADVGKYRVTWAAPAHTYRSRARQRVGKVSQVALDLPRAETAFLSLLPYAVKGVRVEAKGVRAGEPLGVRIQVQADAAALEDHVLHVELRAPDGSVPAPYRWNVVARKGKATVELPTALNDAAGEWTLTVTDVASGVTAQAKARLSR